MYQINNDDEKMWGDSKYPIEHIYIEQPFTFFNSGGSSAKTMASLQSLTVLFRGCYMNCSKLDLNT